MDVLREYVTKFGDFPPLVETMGYENDFYTKIMKEAIENNDPITNEVLNTKLVGEKFDIVLDDNDVDAREYARRNAK